MMPEKLLAKNAGQVNIDCIAGSPIHSGKCSGNGLLTPEVGLFRSATTGRASDKGVEGELHAWRSKHSGCNTIAEYNDF